MTRKLHSQKVPVDLSDEKKKFWLWVKDHKKQLALAGITICTILSTIFIIHHRKSLISYWDSLKSILSNTQTPISKPETTITTVPTNSVSKTAARSHAGCQFSSVVSPHLRNLPMGCHHSKAKVAQAQALGISLRPNQTLVDSYIRCVA